MTKGTATLRAGIWSEFQAWVAEECGDEVWRTLEQQPDLLVEVLLSYGQRLYDRGRSLQEFRQLLAHCQHVVPRVKTILKPAWTLLTKWEKLEPSEHRTPMPEPIAWAMVDFWSCATLFCFLGCCRIGEVLGLLGREELIFSRPRISSSEKSLLPPPPRAQIERSRCQSAACCFRPRAWTRFLR